MFVRFFKKILEWFKSTPTTTPATPPQPTASVPAPTLEFKPQPLPWMRVAYGELGVKEIVGPQHNPRVLKYLQGTSYRPANSDEIPWCSAFVDWCFDQVGVKSTNSAAASSWLEWGMPLTKPRYGCIVVSKRPGGNHVNFFIRLETRDQVPGYIGLGGNQSNAVNEQWRPLSSVLGYRWPLA